MRTDASTTCAPGPPRRGAGLAGAVAVFVAAVAASSWADPAAPAAGLLPAGSSSSWVDSFLKSLELAPALVVYALLALGLLAGVCLWAVGVRRLVVLRRVARQLGQVAPGSGPAGREQLVAVAEAPDAGAYRSA